MTWLVLALAARSLVVHEPLGHADVLLVMSGAPVYAERLRHAAELFGLGQADRVLLTNDGQRGGWSRAQQRNPTSVERATDTLVAAGVPRDRIEVLPGVVRGTIDEARLVRDYISTGPVRSVLVVTSAYHSRRAVWTIRRALRALPVAVGVDPAPNLSPSRYPATWWLHWGGWLSIGLEFVKLPYYWVAHR